MTQNYAGSGQRIQTLEARYRGNPDLHPWQLSEKRNDFDPDFIEYIRQFLSGIKQSQRAQAGDARKGDALAYINLRQSRGESMLATLEGRWEDYQEEKKQAEARAAAEQATRAFPVQPGSGDEFDPTTTEAQAARARARRAAKGLSSD